MSINADLIAYAKTSDIWSDPLVQDLTAALEAADRDNAELRFKFESGIDVLESAGLRRHLKAVAEQRDALAAQITAAREALDWNSPDPIRGLHEARRILSASDAGAILRVIQADAITHDEADQGLSDAHSESYRAGWRAHAELTTTDTEEKR